jgi:hypothetical protein
MSNRYRKYSDGKGKIVIVSTYAGKTVRGVAKCSPNDNFVEAAGVELATLRCDAKIADKRVKRARAKYNEAVAVLNKANEAFEKAVIYLRKAEEDKVAADKEVFNCMKEMGMS